MGTRRFYLGLLVIIGIFFFNLFLLSTAWAADYDYSSPENTFETYKAALRNRDVEYVNRCLTYGSLQSGAAHNDPSRYPSVLSFLGNRQYRVRRFGNRAVLDFVPADPKMSSVYLKVEDGEWKIDLKFVRQNIIYDYSNNWHWRNNDAGIERRWIAGN